MKSVQLAGSEMMKLKGYRQILTTSVTPPISGHRLGTTPPAFLDAPLPHHPGGMGGAPPLSLWALTRADLLLRFQFWKGCGRQILRGLKAAAEGGGRRKGESAVRLDSGSQSLSREGKVE